ncbi:MAG: ABC transporter permease [Candidatus Wallbacteria bacterium]|nr:ABC transporter permease [Candidatus Wallbacteria bacterium]
MKALLAEVWSRRALVASLWRSDVLGRYANSAAGFIWAILAPLALIVVYTAIFSALLGARVPGGAGGPARPLGSPIPNGIGFGFFVFAGMLPWMIVQQTAQNAPGSLLNHGATLRRFAIPPSVVPAAVVLSAVTDAAIAGALFVVVLAATGRLAPVRLLALAPAVALLAMMALGLGLAASALNLYGRDVAHAVAALLPFWFFATPVCYPSEALPLSLQWALALNPMDGFLQTARWAMVGGALPSVLAVVWSAAAAVGALALGAWIFQETRGDFADLL